MNIKKILDLHHAIGICSAPLETNGVKQYFKFTGKTRLILAKTLRQLNTHKEDYENACKNVVKQYGGPWKDDDKSEDRKNAVKEINLLELEEIKDQFDLSLPESEFTSDENNIPPYILEILLDYLK